MAKTVRRFQYQTRDPDVVKQRSNQRGGDFDSIYKEGIKVFKPREGKNTIRILPPTWLQASHYGYDLYVNYGIGIDEQAYLSLSEMKKQPDPLAEARREAEKDGDKKLADSLKPSKRVAFYLIDRMAEDEGVQLWPAPWTVDKSFCGIAIDEESGAATMVDHPDEGYDITFYKEGTGMMTKYPAEKMRIKRQPSPLSEDENQANEWLNWIQEHPIPDMLNFYDYEHIAAAFEGHTPRDKDEPPKAQGKRQSNPLPDEPKPRAKPQSRYQPSEDEEVDEDTGEITTKSNGKPKPAVRKVESVDEDENEAEEAAAKMSVSSIRDRLAGRRQRPAADED